MEVVKMEAKRMEMGKLMEELKIIFESGQVRDNFGKIAELSGKLDKLSEEIKNN